MTTTGTPLDPTTRRVPPFGGLNATLLRIELKRMLRNRRTIVFALVFPTAMFFVFGSGGDSQESVGVGNVSAYVMVSMAMYGGALIAASAGAGVAVGARSAGRASCGSPRSTRRRTSSSRRSSRS
jgi:ABC-2 type transport system permease protein